MRCPWTVQLRALKNETEELRRELARAERTSQAVKLEPRALADTAGGQVGAGEGGSSMQGPVVVTAKCCISCVLKGRML